MIIGGELNLEQNKFQELVLEKLGNIEQRLDNLEQGQQEIKESIRLLENQTIQGFREVNEQIKKSIRVSEFISSKMVEHEVEIRNLNKIIGR